MRVVSQDPVVFTEATAVGDQNVAAAGIGCAIHPTDPRFFRCNLLDSVDPDGTVHTGIVNIWYAPEFEAAMAMVRCDPAGRYYNCYQPSWEFDHGMVMANLVTDFGVERRDRPTVTISTGQSIGFEFLGSESDLVDSCIGDWFIDGLVDGYLRRSLDRFVGDLGGLLAPFLGSRLDQDYMVPLSRIPLCGPPGTPEHYGCWADSAIPYSAQHLCTNDATDGQWRCNGARVDFRRIHMVPQGIELVLAEDHTDPQFSIMNGRPGLVPMGSMLSLAFPVDDFRCDPARFDTNVPGVLDVRTLGRGTALIGRGLLIPPVPICEPDVMSCTGICGEIGTTCTAATNFGLLPGLDPAGLCDMGVCRRL